MVDILFSEIIEAFSSSNISPDLTIFFPSMTIFSEEVLPNILSVKGNLGEATLSINDLFTIKQLENEIYVLPVQNR